MTGGGYTPESALKTADEYENTVIAIGRMFISNVSFQIGSRALKV